jgi:RNA polymerase sigma factor (sigma-70 family)
MSHYDINTDCSTDTYLWDQLIQRGDRKVLKALYCQYANLLYNYGMHITHHPDLVKDCIQDLFLDLLKNHQNLSTTTSVKFYLYKALRRKIVYEEKKINRQLTNLIPAEETAHEQLFYEFSEVTDKIDTSKKERILQSVQALPKRQREVIQLIFFENLSREEIAEIMEIDTKSIYVLTWKAIKSLRKDLLPHQIILFLACLLLCFY